MSRHSRAAIFSEHLQWGKHLASLATTPSRRCPLAKARLRVAYVSADLRQHPVAHFIEPIFDAHDRDQFDVYVYSDVKHPDAVSEQLRATVENWRDTSGQSHGELAAMIAADGIDVLIDLSGHTGGNRLAVFAACPAPVQVTYLGYPTTTGLAAMHYRLTDEFMDPSADHNTAYTETLVRIDTGFCVYAPPRAAPATTRANTTHNHVTFASLNQLAKVSPEAIALWSRILRAVPESALVLQAWALRDTDTRALITSAFARHGVASERLELLAHMPLAEHLAIYARVDIALDTLPWSAHTTCCHALWMGVPVVTLAGNRAGSRMAGSVLTQVALPELIAASEEEYFGIAVRLARERHRLDHFNASLRERLLAASLTDYAGFTRKLENTLQHMVEQTGT